MMPIDPRLESSSTHVIDLKLCHVRLSHNAAFPWILLIPKRESIIEIIDLPFSDQCQLMEEISQASRVMKSLFNPTKLNIANLGNVVPQLHIHVIARFKNDKAWPDPIWNSGINTSYSPIEKIERITHIKDAFLGIQKEREK